MWKSPEPYAEWKFKNILQDIPEDVNVTDSAESDTASVGDAGESSDISSPGIASPFSLPPLPHHHLLKLALMVKLKRRRTENHFIKVME